MDCLENREVQGIISSLRSSVLTRGQKEEWAGLHTSGFSFEIHEFLKSLFFLWVRRDAMSNTASGPHFTRKETTEEGKVSF